MRDREIVRAPFHSTKERFAMTKRLLIVVAIMSSAAMLMAGVAAPSAKADSPWWQLTTGSRPTNMWEPTDNVQELETELGPFGAALKVVAQGETVGCLGSGQAGAFFCPSPAIDDATELEALLESVFGTNAVEVTGGPVGTEPFRITTLGREVPIIGLEPANELSGRGRGKTLSVGGSGRLLLTLTNLGNASIDGGADPVVITNHLPAGVEATGPIEAVAGMFDKFGPVECSLNSPSEVACTFDGNLPPYRAIEVEIPVVLVGQVPLTGEPGTVTVSGGGAASTSAQQSIRISPDATPFGIERFLAAAEDEGGVAATHAGAHPYQFATTIQPNSGRMIPGSPRSRSFIEQPAMPRNLRFALPAGLVGNAVAVPQCTMKDFLGVGPSGFTNDCGPESAVGVASVTVSENIRESSPPLAGYYRLAVPIFNLNPSRGEPARFGFTVARNPVVIDTALDPDDEYRILAKVSNVTQLIAFSSSTVVLWGAPSDPSHDVSRGWACINELTGHGPCQPPTNRPRAAFLRQPVSCDGPLALGAEIEPWNVPLGSQVDRVSISAPGMTACNRVPFSPAVDAESTSRLAENPTGLDFRLDMPNAGLLEPEAIAEAQPKKVQVTLPEGMTINPSQAEGLTVCSADEYARETFDSNPGAGCPDASKIGEVQVSTPLLKEEARGSLYVAKPYDNPFDSLLALYIVAKIPERGVLIKQAGKIEPDPRTGQLVTTFDDLPQLPFSSFRLHFREGGRASLVTPPTCGPAEVVARFTPWSAVDPDNPMPNEVVTRTSSMTIDRGVDGGGCPSGGTPFRPGFEAGSINPAAGKFSPFYMRLTRRDGDQDLTKFSATLPKGALAKLAGVAQCPQAAVDAAKGRDGLAEKASPSCPESSRIGRTTAGAGVGSILTYVPGQLYLGGPYKGAPLSVVSITPAVAGPFDVGTVVVQEALRLEPRSGEVRVDGDSSDPIPHILEGIPLKLRDLRVYVDRDQFTTTPTSCDPMATRAELFGSGADVFNVADDTPTTLSSRYQAANCGRLGFKPRLSIRLSAKRSTRGANPRLRAVLRPRLGNSNPERISVTLPGSELLEQAHIRTICTRAQYAANGGMGVSCPKGSVYGHVKAWTPLLDRPLQGPVFLRSSSNELPDMVLALRGLVDVEAVGRIDSVNARIRTTFDALPDAPLSKVVLTMQGGGKSLLANSTDICRGVHRANAGFTGQNGKVHQARPRVAANCKRKRR
jgi:hypothetical protein